MIDRLYRALIRVWGPDDRPAGVGFLVGDRHALTAAHVAARATGLDDDGPTPPAVPLSVDFPLVQPGVRHQARVVVWRPITQDGTGDIAGLELLTPRPTGAGAAPLTTRDFVVNQQVAVFGVPRVADSGVWSIGRIRGPQSHGWLQIDTQPDSQFTIEEGFSGAPVWDIEREAVQGMVVTAHLGGRIRTGYLLPSAALVDGWPDLGTMVWPPSPYPGLRTFEEADADVFHGRSALTARVRELTRHAPVITVLGPSGTGKSSLIKAGVLPALRVRDDVVVATLRPSEASTPLGALALALDRVLVPERDPLSRLAAARRLADELARGGIATIVSEIAHRHGGRGLLVFIDQFEEALAADQEQVVTFGSVLRHCLAPASRMRLLLTLRADHLGAALHQPAVAPLVDDRRTVLVGELSREELREAITVPVADLHTVTFEPGLVDRILDDVGMAPGRLPLLQFALRELWSNHHAGMLTHQAYEQIGRVDHALANRAEQVWDALAPGEQTAARRLLVQLLRPDPDGPTFSSRAATKDELDAAQWSIVQRLVAARLLVARDVNRLDNKDNADRAGVAGAELAHVALATHWTRLHEFQHEERDFRLWQEELRRRITRWRVDDRHRRRLLTGADLHDAQRWLSSRHADLPPAEHSFITASWQRRKRRVRWTASAIAVLLVGAMVAGGFVLRLRQQADAEHRLVLSRQLAAEAVQVGNADPARAALLAIGAWQASPTKEAREALITTQGGDVLTTGGKYDSPPPFAAFQPDGNLIATTGDDQHAGDGEFVSYQSTITMHDRSLTSATSKPVWVRTSTSGKRWDSTVETSLVRFSRDGDKVAWATPADESVRLLKADTGEILATYHHGCVLRDINYSVSGGDVFVDVDECDSGEDSQRIILDASSLDRVAAMNIPPPVGSASWQGIVTFPLGATSPDGETAAWTDSAQAASGHQATMGVTDSSKYFHLVDLDSRKVLAKVGNDGQIIRAITFSPDSELLATASEDNALRLWDVTNRKSPQRTLQFKAQEQLNGAVISDDGSFIVTIDTAGDALLWRTNPEQAIRTLCGRLDLNVLSESWRALGPDRGDPPRCPA